MGERVVGHTNMLGKQCQIDDATQCVEYKKRNKISENSEIFGRDKCDNGKYNTAYDMA